MDKFWNFIKNEETEETELYFEGPISTESWLGDEITPALVRDELAKVSGDLTVWINSPGGDCISASQIYTMLKNHKSKVTVKIDGIAASAASVVAMAGDETWISPTGYLMIHNPMTCASGNKADLEKAIKILEEVKESIINAYEIKTGLSRAKLSHLMDAETWMDAHSAVEMGFADEVMKRSTENEDAAGPQVSMVFSRTAVTNSLMDKLAAKCRIQQKQDNSGRSVDTLMERLELIKNHI